MIRDINTQFFSTNVGKLELPSEYEEITSDSIKASNVTVTNDVTTCTLRADSIVTSSLRITGGNGSGDSLDNLQFSFNQTVGATAFGNNANASLVVNNRLYQNLQPQPSAVFQQQSGYLALAKQAAPMTSFQNGKKCISAWNQATAAFNTAGWRDIEWSSELNIFVAVSGARDAANGGSGSYLLPPGSRNVQYSMDGLVWYNVTWSGLPVNAQPDGNVWFGVKWAAEAGVFVAVAKQMAYAPVPNSTSHFAYSQDGKTWMMVPYNAQVDGVVVNPDVPSNFYTQNTWAGLAWSPNLLQFTCVSNNNLCTTFTIVNGVPTWPAQPVYQVLNNFNVNATLANTVVPQFDTLVWAPELGQFVAPVYVYSVPGITNPLLLPPGDLVVISSDGLAWTSIALPLTLHAPWKSIIWSPELGMLCAVAEQTADTTTGSTVMTSFTGTSWSGVPYAQTQGNESRFRNITWAPEYGMFLCGAFNNVDNKLLYSFDGVTWSLTGNPTVQPASIRNIVYARELCTFILCADGSAPGAITGIANNGGLIEVATLQAHNLSTGASVLISGVAAGTNANGTWIITVVDGTHFTLDTSVFATSATAGGTFELSIPLPGYMFESSNVFKLPGPNNVFNACFNRTDEDGNWGMGSAGQGTMPNSGGVVTKTGGYFCIPSGGLGTNTLPTTLSLTNSLNTGYAPMFYDTDSNKLFIYNFTDTQWRSATFA